MPIIAIAPCRISLFGGGTDVYPFAHEFGGQVLSVAVNIYHQTTLKPRRDKIINLRALGENRQISDYSQKLAYGQDKKFDLLRAIINYFRPQMSSGFDLDIKLSLPAATGLGSSASAAVTVISALNVWLKTKLNRQAIGLLAGNLEVDELSWPGGKQDGIASAVGGVNLIFFGPGDAIKVKPIKLSRDLEQGFMRQALLFYIGGQRHSGDQQEKLIKGMSDNKKIKALQEIKASVAKSLGLWQREQWLEFGQLMGQSWLNKKTSNPIVSNSEIDRFYRLAMSGGAYGGKLLGSGGAGHLFFLVDPLKKSYLIKKMTASGAKLINFKLDHKGVTVKSDD